MPDRLSCLNFYPCVIKVQSISQSFSPSLTTPPTSYLSLILLPPPPQPHLPPTCHRAQGCNAAVWWRGPCGSPAEPVSYRYSSVVPSQKAGRRRDAEPLWPLVYVWKPSLQNDAVITTINVTISSVCFRKNPALAFLGRRFGGHLRTVLSGSQRFIQE